jgi:hypothetical protein
MRDVDHRVIVAAGPTERQGTAHRPTVPTRDVIAWDDGQASLWHGGGFRKSRKATASANDLNSNLENFRSEGPEVHQAHWESLMSGCPIDFPTRARPSLRGLALVSRPGADRTRG